MTYNIVIHILVRDSGWIVTSYVQHAQTAEATGRTAQFAQFHQQRMNHWKFIYLPDIFQVECKRSSDVETVKYISASLAKAQCRIEAGYIPRRVREFRVRKCPADTYLRWSLSMRATCESLCEFLSKRNSK